MVFSVDDVRSVINKSVEKISASRLRKEPDLALLELFTSNAWRAAYLAFFYTYHGLMRVVSLWLIFSYVSNFVV